MKLYWVVEPLQYDRRVRAFSVLLVIEFCGPLLQANEPWSFLRAHSEGTVASLCLASRRRNRTDVILFRNLVTAVLDLRNSNNSETELFRPLRSESQQNLVGPARRKFSRRPILTSGVLDRPVGLAFYQVSLSKLVGHE